MSRPRILVVDDEPGVLNMVVAVLSSQDYDIHAASNPVQALELANAMAFDLVVSDVVMPDICGPELVRRIERICPNTAFVLMSGYIATDALPDHAAFICKPFTIEALRAVVEKALAFSR